MNNAKNLLGVSTILLILSACNHYEPPKTELCVFGDSGGICTDPRKPRGEREYTLQFPDMLNYICTGPEDWDYSKQWWLEKLERLEKCEGGIKHSKDKLKHTDTAHF